MFKAAIFDLDDTLYSFEGVHPRALDAVAAELERLHGFPREKTRAENSRLFKLQQEQTNGQGGCHSRCVRFQILCEEQGFPLSLATKLDELYWSVYLSDIVPFPGVPELLDELRARGVRVGVGTNMTARWQLLKLEKLGLLDRIDFMVSSEEAGADKPSPKLFDLCVRKAGCAPSECVFTGDNAELDARAADACGLHGVWFAPDEAARAAHPDLRSVVSLKELLPLFEAPVK